MNINIFDTFPEPVLLLGPDCAIQYSNPAALALEPGWTPGRTPPPELQGGSEGTVSCTLGGRLFQASRSPAEGGTLLLLRPAEAALANAVRPERLAAYLREGTQQFAMAAHLLARKLADGGEEARQELAALQQAICRQVRLIRHLEQAGDIEQARELGTASGALDLAELCRQTAYGAGFLASTAGVSFREKVADGILPAAGDRDLLEQMLLELISNAIKAAGPGGEAGLEMTFTARQAKIVVWDSGPGMEHSGALQPADRPPKPGCGLGLGLALARYAAAAHGGTILTENTPGLRVTVSLPVRRPAMGALSTPKSGPKDGYSNLLTFLSDALPWQAFIED